MDLTTHYMGLTLKHPVVPSASPLSQKLDGIKQLEDAGAAAIVMYSLFEEQIDSEALALHYFLERGRDSYAEALTYFPRFEDFVNPPEKYLKLVQQAKASVSIPIIGSLNGVTMGGWTDYARMMQEAGADGVELNVYYIPTSMDLTGSDVEQLYLDILREVKSHVSIPVAMKLSPYFSAMPRAACRLDEDGADALVLFNRFYQPDFNLEDLEVVPNLVLSTSAELRLPLRWVAILYGRIRASLALTSGVHTAEDVLKAVAAGADIANVTSVLLKQGPRVIGQLVEGVSSWLETHEYESLAQMKGSLSQRNCAEPAAFERANYMKAITGFRWEN